MVSALTLLLAALGLLLYQDRDFWFPNTQEAEEQPAQTVPATAAANPAQRTAVAANAAPAGGQRKHGSTPQPKAAAPAAPSTPPVTTTTRRSVLPPLEVEVVAGDVHRTVLPTTNSVRVDLQPGSPPQAVPDASAAGDAAETAASVTSDASERVRMSAGAAEIVSQPVKPGYPLLARQMKVQGSVILQALIGRDGLIQNLRVLRGPPILAGAAQEAVKQWHFKPHYHGAEAVETQAKITVNFTISTN